MALRSVIAAQLLPPLGFAWIALLGGLLAWRRARLAGSLAVAGGLGTLVLAMPFVAGALRASLEDAVPQPSGAEPAAIVILGAETSRGIGGTDPGPLTLERLRAGAALHRRTGLPVLVTGGRIATGQPPIAQVMATSLSADFGVSARWIEPAAGTTRDNATLSAAMLRAEGIGTVHVVSHGWHLARASAAFERAGLGVRPAPVRRYGWRPAAWQDLVPRPMMLGASWLMLREWTGILVYRLRDGAA
jgi:uncharacterized SAM-binding protein YcdF (DUF218 family)